MSQGQKRYCTFNWSHIDHLELSLISNCDTSSGIALLVTSYCDLCGFFFRRNREKKEDDRQCSFLQLFTVRQNSYKLGPVIQLKSTNFKLIQSRNVCRMYKFVHIRPLCEISFVSHVLARTQWPTRTSLKSAKLHQESMLSLQI